MAGGDLVIVVLLALGWLFYFSGALMNAHVVWLAWRAKAGERVPSGIFIIFGVWGAFLAYHSVYTIAPRYSIDVPWPLFWVLLPLFLDVYCAGFLVFLLVHAVSGRISKGRDEPG